MAYGINLRGYLLGEIPLLVLDLDDRKWHCSEGYSNICGFHFKLDLKWVSKLINHLIDMHLSYWTFLWLATVINERIYCNSMPGDRLYFKWFCFNSGFGTEFYKYDKESNQIYLKKFLLRHSTGILVSFSNTNQRLDVLLSEVRELIWGYLTLGILVAFNTSTGHWCIENLDKILCRRYFST